MSVSIDLPTPRRVLAVGAHPDDIEFGCGATLAKWSAAGSVIWLVVLTDGSKGSWDAEADPARLADLRVEEQAAAARVLGAAEVLHAGFVDGELANGYGEREAVVSAIRRARPTVLLTHDPWKRYRLHPDHRADPAVRVVARLARVPPPSAARHPAARIHRSGPHPTMAGLRTGA